METLAHFVFTAVIAAGAGRTAAAYATTKRPLWAAATVFLAVAAVVWGMYAVMTTVVDDLLWRLDVLLFRTEVQG